MHEKLSEAGHMGGETTKETHGREFYQEIGKKGGAAPKGEARREVPEGEVIVRRSGKDLDVMFSSQEKAEEWRNRFASKVYSGQNLRLGHFIYVFKQLIECIVAAHWFIVTGIRE